MCPYIQSIMIIFLSVFLAIVFKNVIIKDKNFLHILNTICEIILFILISTCLSKTKTKSLIYVEIGFIFLIAFNLAHRFSYLTGHYYKSFDMAWLICYVIISYGLFISIKFKEERIEFFEKNSIHVLINTLLTMFATLLFILFLFLGFVISSIEINDIGSLSIFPESIPSILVFSFSLSALIGKLVANSFSKPLEKISRRIDIINENKFGTNDIPGEKFEIYEVEKLSEFIVNVINELRTANRVKSEFLMNMSHDFRTPASGIYHMSRSIYRKTNDPELKKLQKLIVNSSEQLMNFLEDVLDYSRLDSNQYELNVGIIDIKAIINEVILFVSAKAKEKMLNINFQFSEPSINYNGDRLMIHRILLNIVSNAIKFTHAGSIIIFTNVEKFDDGNWVVISVKDTGIGIDEIHHKLIFDPFSRIERPETSKYPGIGLGLSNVLLMLKKMGGKITVESSLNQGATFNIFLPV
ncbi:MAG: hypothetical protein A3F17_09020 [Gammaproteobacteria bacterium RIFCSPHIGHO2_12_FULL_41_15]|nr:MAG: hypothetical protein A3F17_09020 [Gammaproteobacteria bacterium RIFCSPHIGHO2_12_FULL_41_15]